jgi:predicted ester cyclase
MSTDENKAVVRRLMEETSQGNLAVIDELIAPDFVFHNPSDPSVGGGPEGYRRWTTQRGGDLGDERVTIDDQLADGDKVATRFTVRATHAETGKAVTITVIAIDQLLDGRLVAHWDEADLLGLMQQIGAIPAPGQQTS